MTLPQTHGFRSPEIRRSMDVFGLDGEKVGTIIWVIHGPEAASNIPENPPFTPEIRAFDGESLGPAPTREVGNFGPATQTPEHRYGADTTTGEPLGAGAILVGTWYGLFGRRRIALDEVQTVSMERVILRRAARYYLG